MRYYSHLTAGYAASLAVSTIPLLPAPSWSAAGGAGLILGSLLPDIDQAQSFIGRRSRGLASIIQLLFGHRGLTHSGIVLFGAGTVWFTAGTFFSALAFGVIVHLLADLCSRGGIPLFAPFDKKRTSIPLYRTGKFSEYVVTFCLIAYIGLFHSWWTVPMF
ncbi:metal-dependent hydrolase [Alkalicoccus urumqiensis]|uniref:Metal-dependent hydrolase n=1 Tax=Alkalicoccus urumqiensis TaxID=1548213 RepID=A0A2P6MI36_ALKUR|nr:metal-dependent hydrolase [Alkalicoccus urumqiensis]PRO65946.1 hypothetical protein C6I21_06480 [Alkalicoccus urumqiensis]